MAAIEASGEAMTDAGAPVPDVARHPALPAAMVSFPPAFWMLVPGALALVGVTAILAGSVIWTQVPPATSRLAARTSS